MKLEWETIESSLARLSAYAETLSTEPRDPNNWPDLLEEENDAPQRYRALYADVVALPGELVPCTLHPRQLMPNTTFTDEPAHEIGNLVLMWTWTNGKKLPENIGVIARIVALGVLDPPRPRLALVRSLRRVRIHFPFLHSASCLNTAVQVQRAIQDFWDEYTFGKTKFTIPVSLCKSCVHVVSSKDCVGWVGQGMVEGVQSVHKFFESKLHFPPTMFRRDFEDCMKYVDPEDVAWAKFSLDAGGRREGLMLETTLDRAYAWMKRGVHPRFNFDDIIVSATVSCAACGCVLFNRDAEMRMRGEKFSCSTFVNPQGMTVHLSSWERSPTANRASGHGPRMVCRQPGNYIPEFSWFPNFGWNPTSCPDCFSLLGWAYRSNERTDSNEADFWGLIEAAVVSSDS